jgi:hypothetical protein
MASPFDDQAVALHLEGLSNARRAAASSGDFFPILFEILPQQKLQVRDAGTFPDDGKDHTVRGDIFVDLHPSGCDRVDGIAGPAPALVLPVKLRPIIFNRRR